MMENSAAERPISPTNTTTSGDSENETPDVSATSAVSTSTTFSDLGEVSVVSRKQKQAALRWSKKEKRKAKEKAKKKQFNKITKGDFQVKSMEFKLWLLEAKAEKFENLNPKKQKEYFKKFIKKWNAKKLDKKYYRGVDCLWAMGSPATPSWGMPSLAPDAITPGGIEEHELEEKYSRQHRQDGTQLGTFGKKAGAQLLRQLRAVENTSAVDGTGQVTSDSSSMNMSSHQLADKKNTSCHANSTTLTWMPSNIMPAVIESSPILPPPPSPCKWTESDLHSTIPDDEGMSPLPPLPIMGTTSSGSCQSPHKTDNTTKLTALKQVIPVPPNPPAVQVPPKPSRPKSCILGSEKSLKTRPHNNRSVRGRPLSYAGEPSYPPPPPPPRKPGNQASTNTAQASNLSQKSSVLVSKSRSQEILKRTYSKANPAPPPPPNRSVSLENVNNRHGPNLPKIAKRTVSLECQSTNASHAVFQTLTQAKGTKKPGEVTPVRTNAVLNALE